MGTLNKGGGKGQLVSTLNEGGGKGQLVGTVCEVVVVSLIGEGYRVHLLGWRDGKPFEPNLQE